MLQTNWGNVWPMSLLNAGDLSGVATTDLGTITPGCEVVGGLIIVDTVVVPGGSVAGTLAFERGGVEIATWDYTAAPAGTWFYIPFSRFEPSADAFVLTIKTAAAGAGGTGNVRGYLVVTKPATITSSGQCSGALTW